MFGKDKVLTEGLEAQALVLDKSVYATTVQKNATSACKYKLLVRFQDGTESEIERRVFHAELAGVPVGSLLPVRYDPDDHSKVEIDGDAMKAAATAQDEARREHALERGRAELEGRGPASTASEISSTAERVTERVANISAATNDISETMEAIKRAKAAGDTAEVERLKAEFQSRMQQRQGS